MEALVVADHVLAPPAAARVVGSLPPHITIVAGASPAALLALPGVRAVFTVVEDTVQLAGDPGDLPARERLFIRAWQQQATTSKTRVGDGAAWDAPGFLPPDDDP
jgi:hypothetical protein